MATSSINDDSSEDEVFFGPCTLKEIRARLLPRKVRRKMKYLKKKKDINEGDNSITIIEMHSEPEMNINNDPMNSPSLPTVFNNDDYCSVKPTDNSYLRLSPNDSFIKLEQQVADCCVSEQRNNAPNNHSEVDNFYFKDSHVRRPQYVITNNNACLESRDSEHGLFKIDTAQHCNNPIMIVEIDSNISNETSKEKTNKVAEDTENMRMGKMCTVHTQENLTDIQNETLIKKINKIALDSENGRTEENGTSKTPCNKVSIQKNKINRTDIFKTPISMRKQQVTSIKTSLSKVNAYQHVVSPIALYIRNSQTPLVRNTKPSSIPTLKKCPSDKKMSNKENVQLQPVACGTHKGTALVHTKKLAQIDLKKKQTPSAFVLRKNARGDVNPTKKPFVPQNDSAVNLSRISKTDEISE